MLKQTNCLTLIAARGGSKGLPGKNIRSFAGKPLIAHAIECARRVPQCGDVIVSTDSLQIAEIAQQFGVQVPFIRPAELAHDTASIIHVIQHALATMEQAHGKQYTQVMLLEPTSPGRIPEDLERAFAELQNWPEVDGVVACSKPHFNPIWTTVYSDQGYIQSAWPDANQHIHRQSLPPTFRINGVFFLWKRSFIAQIDTQWRKGRHRMIEIPEIRSFSIDTMDEFQLAELAVLNGLVSLPWLL